MASACACRTPTLAQTAILSNGAKRPRDRGPQVHQLFHAPRAKPGAPCRARLEHGALAAIGSHKANLLSATIYLTNAENAAAFNAHWEAWLPADCAPSRACVKVELLDPKMLVEIAFVAAVN